jgi:hypothetical protein
MDTSSTFLNSSAIIQPQFRLKNSLRKMNMMIKKMEKMVMVTSKMTRSKRVLGIDHLTKTMRQKRRRDALSKRTKVNRSWKKSSILVRDDLLR